MSQSKRVLLRIGWICLATVSLGILVFGIVVAVVPLGGDARLYRADGLASIGLGLFGGLLALVPFRRGERWAWFALWFYPIFWTAHLVGRLPPGTDHIHQVVFIVLSLVGLLLPLRTFFPSPGTRHYETFAATAPAMNGTSQIDQTTIDSL